MQEPVRLLALDMDGTLLRSDLTVSSRNRAAVQACLDRGIDVVLASGRIYPTITPYLSLWPAGRLWVAAANGAVIYAPDGVTALWKRPIDAPVARAVTAWASAEGIYVKAYVDDRLFVNRVTEETLRFRRLHGIGYHHLPDLAEQLPGAPSKMVMADDSTRLPLHEAQLRRRWGTQLEISASTPDSMELTAFGVNKGEALRFVAGRLGIGSGQVAAIGNERNDLSMITWAGRGAAVANAAQAVRTAAPQVVAHHDADGVAEFIEGWL